MTDENPQPKKKKPRKPRLRPGFKNRKSAAQKAKENKWQKQLIALSKKGMPTTVAAACAGISLKMVYKSFKTNPEFKQAYYQARGGAQKTYIEKAAVHFRESPAFVQWYLTKVYQETFRDKDRDKIPTRQVYAILNRWMLAAIDFVDPERRSSFLQAMDDAMSQSEATDATGNIRKVREKIINGTSPLIENDVTGDGGEFED